MEEKDLNIIMKDFIATYMNPSYGGNFDLVKSKFPELDNQDPQVLKDYLATYLNPQYNGDIELVNSKFPELFQKKNLSGQGSRTGSEMSDTGSALSQDFNKIEEQDYFTGAFGSFLRGIDSVVPIGVGDFIDDMARSVASGYRQGQSAKAADNLLLKGSMATNEEISKFIEANKNAQSLSPSAEMQEYQKIYEDQGKGFWGVIKGLANNPSVLPEVLVSSMTAMATNTDALKAGASAVGAGAGVGALTGLPAGGVGAIPGAVAGASASVPYAFGLASSVLEMGATFGELLQEELEGEEMTKDNVKSILENPERLTSIRNRAIARGLIIGTVDAFTGKLASGVGAKIISKSAAKSATGAATKSAVTKSTAVGSVIEGMGGSLGEATARAAIGQEMDISEISLEGLAELPGGMRATVQARFEKPSYKVNGESVSAGQVDQLINTMSPSELSKTNFEIKNDYEGRQIKIQDKITTAVIADEIKKAKPNLNETTVNAIVELQKELNKLEGNKTEVAKDRASILREDIKNLQENQLADKAELETKIPESSAVSEEGTSYKIDGATMDKPRFVEAINEATKEDSLNELETNDPEIQKLIDQKRSEITGVPITESVDTELNQEVEQLRAQEQAELAEALTNPEQYMVDGVIDGDKITDPAEKKIFDDIYKKYDERITPLLEASKTIPETAKDSVKEYVEELNKTKSSDPETYWSVDEVSPDAAAEGTIIKDEDGYGVVGKDGDVKGVFKKLGSKAKGVAQKILKKAVEAGGIKLDNFDTYLTDVYKKAGFRVVSRTKFNEEFAPEGWSKEKHGTPDVVAMVYDPDSRLNIEEKLFDNPETGYDEMIKYRDSFVEQAKSLYPIAEKSSVQTKVAEIKKPKVAEKKTETDKKDAIIQSIKKAGKTLKIAFPDVKFVVGKNAAETRVKIIEELTPILGAAKAKRIASQFYSANGQATFVDGKAVVVAIDQEKATLSTAPHEVWHVILREAFGKSPKKFEEFRNGVANSLINNGFENIAGFLDDFSSLYDGNITYEEYLAELGGQLVAQRVDPSKFSPNEKSFIQEFKELVNKIARDVIGKDVFLKDATPENILDFMISVSSVMAEGGDIRPFIKSQPSSLDSSDGIESLKKLNPEEIRKRNSPGKRISKGLGVSTVDGVKTFREESELSIENTKNNSPSVFISNAGIISKYPLVALETGAIIPQTIEDAQKVYDIFKERVSENLVFLIDNFKKEFKDISTLWYDGANFIANNFASKYGVTAEQVAGIMASLSPQKDWYMNVRLAELTLMAYRDNPVLSSSMIDSQVAIAEKGLYTTQGSPGKKLRKAEREYKKSRTKANKESLDDAREKLLKAEKKAAKVIESLRLEEGKNLKDIPVEFQPYVVRNYHEVNTTKDYNIINPDGKLGDLSKKKNGQKAKVAWGSFTEIGKAVSIYNDGSADNITRSLGEKHKIRNFYNNIIDPMSKSGDVTIDTHAVAAALFMPLSGNSEMVGHNFGTKTFNSGPLAIQGIYYAYSDAYADVANKTGLLPRQVQSITWEAVRGLFTDEFKRNRSNVSAINEIWKKYERGEITTEEARKLSVEKAGGINDPSWASGIVQDGIREGYGVESDGSGIDGDGQGSIGTIESASQKPVPEKVSNSLTEDGKGNYVFHHYSSEKRDIVRKSEGTGSMATSREEQRSLSAVGGLAMYYTQDGQKERMVGNTLHTITVPKDKVYYADTDALNFIEEARSRFEKVRPGQAFDANNRVAFITQVANDNGFEMVVSRWRRDGDYRAQTTKELKPSVQNIPMKIQQKTAINEGDNVTYMGRDWLVASLKGDEIKLSREDDFGRKQSMTMSLSKEESRISKIEDVETTSQKELPSRVNQEINNIISEQRALDKKPAEISKEAIKYLKGTDAFAKLNDRLKGKVISGVKRLSGMRVKVTVDEYASLKDQIKLEARAAREVNFSNKTAIRQLSSVVKDMVSKGKISTFKASVIIRRIARTNFIDQNSVNSTISYIADVFDNANLAMKISRASSLIKTARKNVKSKIGQNIDLYTAVKSLLSVETSLIPTPMIDEYLSILEIVGERAKVLNIKDVGDIIAKINVILNSVKDKPPVSESQSKKETVKESVEASESLIKDILSSPLDVSKVSDQNDSVIARFLASINIKDLKGLLKTNSDGTINRVDIKTLAAVRSNIEAGLVTHQAIVLAEKIDKNRRVAKLDGVVSRISNKKLTVGVSRFLGKVKGLVTGKSGILETIRSSPLEFIDDIVGNYNDRTIRNTVFGKLASQKGKLDGRIADLSAKADAAESLFNKGRTDNNAVKAKYKVMAYLIQKEHDSNPDNPGVAPAIDFINETIKAIRKNESSLSSHDSRILESIAKEFSTKSADGKIVLDSDKILLSLSKNDTKAMRIIEDINSSTANEALFTSAVVRGDRVNIISNYIHHAVTSSDASTQSQALVDKLLNRTPGGRVSTKAGTLNDRTPGAKPIAFDPVYAAVKGAKTTLTDFYMTSEIRTAMSTMKDLRESYSEKGPDQSNSLDVINALYSALEESLQVTFQSHFHEDTSMESVVKKAQKLGYFTALASIPRAGAEFLSNVSYAVLSDPATTISATRFVDAAYSTDFLGFLTKIGSSETIRLASTEMLSGKYSEGSSLSGYLSGGRSKSKNKVLDYMSFISKYSTGGIQNIASTVSEALISTPDKAISKPYYIASFVKHFKKETGLEISSSDVKSISEGTSEYLSPQFEKQMESARTKADQEIVRLAASNNSFTTILKNAPRTSDSAMVSAYRAANSFMSRFYLTEYATVRSAVVALRKTGDISKAQAVGIISASATRMSSYLIFYSLLSSAFDSLLSSMFGLPEEEEDEEDLITKTTRSFAGQAVQMMTRRSLGNIGYIPVALAVENLNKEYGEDFGLREGDYDPYKSSLVYAQVTEKDLQTKSPYEIAAKVALGPYGPVASSIARFTVQTGRKMSSDSDKKILDAALESMDERTALEAAGNLGLLPFYKDIRRIMMSSMYAKSNLEKNKSYIYSKDFIETMESIDPEAAKEMRKKEKEMKDIFDQATGVQSSKKTKKDSDLEIEEIIKKYYNK